MRWATLSNKLSKRREAYRANPYWYAWRPVVATTESGEKVWVWREYVKCERLPISWHDGYGGMIWDHAYFYYTIPIERQTNLR